MVTRLTNICVFAVLSFFAALSLVHAQTVKVYVSSKGGDRLSAKPDLQFTDAKPFGENTFAVDDAVKYQKIDGFGASIMEAGIMTLNTLLQISRKKFSARSLILKRVLATRP